MFHFKNLLISIRKSLFIFKLFFLFLILFISQTTYAQLVQDFRVNDDTGSTTQKNGKLGIDGNGNFIVVWKDGRLNYNSQDIFCQIFNSNFQRIGNNFKINSSHGASGMYPKIAVRKDGTFVICWNDTLVRLKIFNSNGTPISPEIIINNIQNLNGGGSLHSIACDTLGNFIVVWEKPIPNVGMNINIQRFDSLGNKIGNDIRVNEDTASNQHRNPHITIRRDGSFIITWEYIAGIAQNIYMQMFDKNGIKIGNNLKIFNDPNPMNQQTYPLISSDDSGRFCIAFSNYLFDYVNYDVICQLYNPNGTQFGVPITINGSSYDEAIATLYKRKNGDFIIGYQKEINLGYFPYCQRMNPNGNTNGTPYPLSNLQPGRKGYDDVAIINDKIISIWTDNRNSDVIDNWDVFCNIRSFLKPDSIITTINNIANSIPKEIKLFQNYPNPFNTMTNVKWQMTDVGNARIVIFDILGKEIEILVNERLHKGTYKVSFDGSNLSSGLYYYTLIIDGEKIDTKKLILLK